MVPANIMLGVTLRWTRSRNTPGRFMLQKPATFVFVFSVEGPIQVDSGLRAPVPQVLGLEIESYEQHVYCYEPFSFYIKGKLRDGYVTLKRYRWEVKEAIKQEQFHHEVTVLR